MADVNTKEIDWGRVSALLGVVHGVAVYTPQMVHLSSAALAELKSINDAIDLTSRQPVAPQSPTEPRPDPDLQDRLSLDNEVRRR